MGKLVFPIDFEVTVSIVVGSTLPEVTWIPEYDMALKSLSRFHGT